MAGAPAPDILEGMPLDRVPTAEGTARLIAEGERLRAADERLEAAKAELQAAQDEVYHLSQRVIPDLFDMVHTDTIGLPESGTTMVLGYRYYANIAVDWEDERRERAFEALEKMGGGDMISNQVTVAFSRGENDLTAEFVEYIMRWNRLGGRQISVKRGCNWSSLTAWFRRRMENKPSPIPTDAAAIGGTITRHAKIVKRK